MEKINTKFANECIKRYESTMKSLGVDQSKGYTKSVGFNKKELLHWMQKLGKDTHEIKIYFGVYPSLSANTLKFENQENSGRFTTFLWPRDEKGEPAKDDEGNEELPVNVGELEP